MRHRLTSAILLLYPRRVRERHGPEIAALIDDLITHQGRSRTRLFVRLAVDGLIQRIASTATAWTVVAIMAATSFGGLAVSDFAAANARKVVPPTVHTIAPARMGHPACRSAETIGSMRGWSVLSGGSRCQRPVCRSLISWRACPKKQLSPRRLPFSHLP
jgi:hypothetical protein